MPRIATRSQACLAAVVAFAIILGGFGCESHSAGQARPASLQGVTIQDSAGVEIVDNQAPERSHGEFWSLSAEPEFVLGGAEHGLAWEEEWGDDRTRDQLAALIFGVSGVARLADGRIAVLSAGVHQVLVFEPSGRLSRAFGGRGPGPGEFVRPEHMQYLAPDTLAVWDHWMGPVSYFDTTGTLLTERPTDRSRTLASLPDATAESRTTPLPDGSFVVAAQHWDPNFPRPPDGTLFRYPAVQFSRIDVATYTSVPLGTWDGPEMWAVPERVREGHQLADMANPGMVLDSHIAVGGDPPMVYISNGDRNEIQQFALDGTLVRSIRRSADPLAVTARADRARKQYLAALAESLGQADVAAFTRALPRRDTHPAVAALVVDTEGHLWVREWSASETGMPDQWSVFSAEGRWLGVLDGLADPWLCGDMAPCWIDRDMFVITRFDEVGRERLEGYRIQRED